jgi:multidrug efflux pump
MGFNLSEWALRNRQIVLFLMILLAVVGTLSYSKLGQSEDPPFTFKAMVIKTNWPGATAQEVSRQVTERIEKKLMETGEYERIVSFSRPGESQVTFMARDSMHSAQIPELWYQVRKKISDIRQTLPPDIQGPFFNDEFGTTFGNIYALTGDGFDYAVLKDYADRIQIQLQRVADVGKVELLGLQDEKIWIELSNLKLATLGLPLAAVQQALQEQNAVSTAGFFETPSERVQLRVSGNFKSVEEIRNFPIRVGDRTFRIGDVADIHRGFNDPPAPRMRYMGADAIGLAVAMRDGGDILVLGKALEGEFARLQKNLPAGMELRKVSDQPAAVKTSVGEFVQVLAEALAIVLLVSFFSLGVRTGMVVALAGHRPAQDFPRRLGVGAGFTGGRRDHRRGNDGDQNGAGLRPAQGRQLCLDQHRIPDAHRYADHRSGLPADCHGAIEHRRVHPFDLPGGDHCIARLVGSCGGVCTLPGGKTPAGPGEDSCGQARHRWPGSLRHTLLSTRKTPGGVVRASA